MHPTVVPFLFLFGGLALTVVFFLPGVWRGLRGSPQAAARHIHSSPSSSARAATAAAGLAVEKHVAVTVALFPLALVAVVVVQGLSSNLAAEAEALARRGLLPPPLDAVAARVAPLRGGEDVALLDVLLAVCVLQAAYGAVLLWRHLVCVARVLKVSLRRALQPEQETFKKMDAMAATAAAKKK